MSPGEKLEIYHFSRDRGPRLHERLDSTDCIFAQADGSLHALASGGYHDLVGHGSSMGPRLPGRSIERELEARPSRHCRGASIAPAPQGSEKDRARPTGGTICGRFPGAQAHSSTAYRSCLGFTWVKVDRYSLHLDRLPDFLAADRNSRLQFPGR